MSYSFEVQAATKAEAKDQVAAKFADVLSYQPEHAADLGTAASTANAFIDALKDTPGMDVLVKVHGSISWGAQPAAENLSAMSLGVSVYHVTRPAT